MAFYNYIGPKPTDGQHYTVDRIDNARGYEEGNVRWATAKQQARNKGNMSNNTSGVKGVQWDNKKHPTGDKYSLYAKATWSTLGGKVRNKAFSVKKYGEELAFFMACEYREQQVLLLNLQGAGYTQGHLGVQQ